MANALPRGPRGDDDPDLDLDSPLTREFAHAAPEDGPSFLGSPDDGPAVDCPLATGSRSEASPSVPLVAPPSPEASPGAVTASRRPNAEPTAPPAAQDGPADHEAPGTQTPPALEAPSASQAPPAAAPESALTTKLTLESGAVAPEPPPTALALESGALAVGGAPSPGSPSPEPASPEAAPEKASGAANDAASEAASPEADSAESASPKAASDGGSAPKAPSPDAESSGSADAAEAPPEGPPQAESTPAKPRPARPLFRTGPGLLLLGWLVLALMFEAFVAAGSFEFPGLAVLVMVLALPMAATLAYLKALDAAALSVNLNPSGFYARLLGRRAMSNLLLVIESGFISLFLVVNLAALRPIDWLLMAAAWPPLLLVWAFFRARLSGELAPWLAPSFAVRLARPLAPFLMLAAVAAGQALVSGGPAAYGSIAEAGLAQVQALDPAASGVFGYLSRWTALAGSVRDFAFGLVNDLSPPAWFAVWLAASWALFYGLSLILSLPLLPPAELRRIFARPSGVSTPPPGQLGRFVWQGLVPSAVALSLIFNLMAEAELAYLGPRGRQADRVLDDVTELVRIGDEYFRSDILAAAADYRRALEELGAEAERRLDEAVDSIFDRYEANVDSYLDWYYSLSGEYARLGSILAADASGFLEDVLAAELSKGVDLAPVYDVWLDVSRRASRFSVELLKARFRHVPPPAAQALGRLNVARAFTGADFLARVEPPRLAGLRARLAVSAGAGVASGVVAGLAARRLVARIAARAFQKVAARQLAKAAAARGASRVAAAASGAALGAAATAATGPGVVAGVVGGLVVGLAASVAADAAMIKIEEIVYRDEYRASLVGVIEQARAEVKGGLSDAVGAAEAPVGEAAGGASVEASGGAVAGAGAASGGPPAPGGQSSAPAD